MTKKHFQAVADSLRVEYRNANESEREVIRRVALNLCVEFRRVNTRFDKARFLAACGFDL